MIGSSVDLLSRWLWAGFFISLIFLGGHGDVIENKSASNEDKGKDKFPWETIPKDNHSRDQWINIYSHHGEIKDSGRGAAQNNR